MKNCFSSGLLVIFNIRCKMEFTSIAPNLRKKKNSRSPGRGERAPENTSVTKNPSHQGHRGIGQLIDEPLRRKMIGWECPRPFLNVHLKYHQRRVLMGRVVDVRYRVIQY